MKKRVLIINTGGTISSIQTARGYEPLVGYVEKVMATIVALKHSDMPLYEIKEYQPLLDSSNMTILDWNRIGWDIAQHYDEFDGFVIFHGTDTMAYTASALSFMLENLSKPVIITGSQIPLSEVRSDAYDHVVTSLWLSAHQPIPEVCIYFNQSLLRGNRTRKIHAQAFEAFASPNYPPLATIGSKIQAHQHLLIPQPTQPFHLQPLNAYAIANFRLFPGFSKTVLSDLLSQSLQALILETYGAGNAPNQDGELLANLRDASLRGMVIVNSTQCQQGSVAMSEYATGYTLKQAGLVSGQDMTPESLYCKLLYLLSKDYNAVTIRQLIPQNLRGEVTE